MNYRVLQVLGIAFTAFLIGIAITNPLVSAAPKTTDKPPPFQVLTDNFNQFGGSWIGGVAGYGTVTIILSANCVTGTVCSSPHSAPVGYVYFQAGSTITEPMEFSWSAFPSPMAQPYTVPPGAETIIILVTSLESTSWPYSLAISLK